jgi:thiamine biosynthesis lipoprotein
MKRALCIFTALLILLSSCRRQEVIRKHIEGQVFGTTYSITYVQQPYDTDRTFPRAQLDSLLADLSHTFSIFDTNSIIYRWNAGEDVELNDDFLEVLMLSKGVSLITDGAFDCTVQPLVQLWGFGKDGVRHTVSEDTLAGVREYVGFQLIDIQGNKVVRKDPRVQLNFNAVAKGYAVDKVADWLVDHGYTNCLVEIGGEVAARGDRNGKNGLDHENGGESWKIGIQRPTETADGNKESFESMELKDHRAVATSGNYRNYFEENGVRYTHILDPRTGQPERTNLLSVTVIAPDCATADAFATAFMVLGYERSAHIVKQHPELETWFIIAEGDGKWKVEKVSLIFS